MSAIPCVEIDLGERPSVTQAGLCVHGGRASESFCLHGLWSLHAYHYDGEMRVAQRRFPFRAGWVSLVPPDTSVEWRFPHHAPHCYAHFALSDSRDGKIALPLLQDLGDEFDRFNRSFEEMIRYQARDPLRAAVRLWDLLHRLRPEPLADAEKRPHPSLQIALSLIREKQAEKITVGELARAMGVSHNHLTGVFKRSYGCGVREYLQRARLARACHLLEHSSLAIKSIAIETGVPDLHYFNKLIRKHTGMSPSAYRHFHARPLN